MIGLQYIRTAKNLSLTDMAVVVGISRQSINQWENGIRPIPQKRLKQLEEYFAIPSEYFSKELTNYDMTRINHFLMKSETHKILETNVENNEDFFMNYSLSIFNDNEKSILKNLLIELENIKMDEDDIGLYETDEFDIEEFSEEELVYNEADFVEIYLSIFFGKNSRLEGNLNTFYYLGLEKNKLCFTLVEISCTNNAILYLNLNDISSISYANYKGKSEYTIYLNTKDMMTLLIN